MPQTDFNIIHDRLDSDSRKWRSYAKDVLPLWIADMDFPAPPEVLQALQARVEHGVFGYGGVQKQLAEVLCQRLWQNYQWAVTPEQIVFLPGLVSALNLSCRAFAGAGDSIVVQTPVYPPFLSAPGNQGQQCIQSPLVAEQLGRYLHYQIDFAAFEASIAEHSKMFILCNPHNPVGRCFKRDELTRLAEICLRHDLVICADEIHCELLLDKAQHIPMASLSEEVAQRCITLMAPSKTFNIAGLFCGFAIVQNPVLLKQLQAAAMGIIPEVNLLGLTAALAAYQHAQAWHLSLLEYLTANRNYLLDYINQHLPMLTSTCPEGTYLAWLDNRQAGITGNVMRFYLNNAKVAFNPGEDFGEGGAGFTRLNFACPRATLAQALQQMHRAIEQR